MPRAGLKNAGPSVQADIFPLLLSLRAGRLISHWLPTKVDLQVFLVTIFTRLWKPTGIPGRKCRNFLHDFLMIEFSAMFA
jgi:hypothetical protein